MQDRLNLVLQQGALAHDVHAPRDLAPARLRVLVGHPTTAGNRRAQLREDLSVDLDGLDLGLGDRPGLLGVGHHHPRHPALEQPHDRVLPVASSATSSLGARLSANTRNAPGVAAICPA
jgi:hypothetical protein